MEINPITDVQNKLLVLDGHAYAYRSFHAIRALSSPDGAPTNAIYGFIKSLDKLIKQLGVGYGLVVWDGGLSEERLKDLPEYKAQRPEMPDALDAQIPEIQKYLEARKIVSFQRPGVEADDVIGSVARVFSKQIDVIIASPDKDFMQLVGDRVGIVNPNDKGLPIWRETDVLDKTGVKPQQIVDWLSLIGDAVDNIKGVMGIGPKTASKLLNQYGDIDHIFESLDEIPPSVWRDNLVKQKEIVCRNRRLIGLKEHPVDGWRLEELKLGMPDENKLAALYKQWGFHSMLRELATDGMKQGELLI
jgi:DNA polymerase-1